MNIGSKFRLVAALGALAFGIALTGCKSDTDKALDQAKAQAAATNTAQQIQYIDSNGDTVTTTVQPPVAGQPQQIATTTAPPAPGPVPHKTDPVITPVGASSAASSTMMAGSNSSMTGPTAAPEGAMSGPPAPVPAAGTPSGPPPAVNMTVPAGTSLAIRINQYINVKNAHAGDHFTGEVAEPVVVNGTQIIASGTHVGGRIDAAHRRGHFKGASVLELRLTTIQLNGAEYHLDTHDNVHAKRGKGRRTAGWIGGMTGAGMLIGGIATGGVGLAIGAAAGAGAGTLIAGTTGNRDIVIPAESIMHFRLADDLVVQN
jgi:hypothetical protein